MLVPDAKVREMGREQFALFIWYWRLNLWPRMLGKFSTIELHPACLLACLLPMVLEI